MYRQGDVLIIPTTKKPTKAMKPVARDNGRLVLAYGEVTGHAHAVHDAGTMLRNEAAELQDLMMLLPGGGTVVHEEHRAIPLAPGNYTVRRQREYTPDAIRNVAD